MFGSYQELIKGMIDSKPAMHPFVLRGYKIILGIWFVSYVCSSSGVLETLVGDALTKMGMYLLVEFSTINEISFEIYVFKRNETQVQKYFEAWALFLVFSGIFLVYFLLGLLMFKLNPEIEKKRIINLQKLLRLNPVVFLAGVPIFCMLALFHSIYHEFSLVMNPKFFSQIVWVDTAFFFFGAFIFQIFIYFFSTEFLKAWSIGIFDILKKKEPNTI